MLAIKRAHFTFIYAFFHYTELSSALVLVYWMWQVPWTLGSSSDRTVFGMNLLNGLHERGWKTQQQLKQDGVAEFHTTDTFRLCNYTLILLIIFCMFLFLCRVFRGSCRVTFYLLYFYVVP